MKNTKAHIFYLHIFVLAGFALAQPLYDLIRQYPTFLVAHDVSPTQLVLFVVLISFGIPLALTAVQFVAGFPRAALRLRIQLAIFFVFSTLILLPVFKKITPGDWTSLFSVVASGVLTYGYYRLRQIRTFVTFLTPAVLVFPVLFLFADSVRPVLFPEAGRVTQGITIQSTPPIVYIVFDEFTSISLMDENRNIDADRFPNFAVFADDSYWCRNATTNSWVTRFAVPALLTGSFPPEDPEMLPILNNYPRNLFTLLHEHYTYNVIEPLTELCPGRFKEHSKDVSFGSFLQDIGLVYAHVVTPGGISGKLPPVSHNWTGFLDGKVLSGPDPGQISKNELSGGTIEDWQSKLEVVQEKPGKREDFREFVASIAEQRQPSFNFYHCPLPHRPHEYLPSTRHYDTRIFADVDNMKKWIEDSVIVGMAYQRYMLQLQFVDTLVGELIDTLKKSGLYDESLIILTSDHGVNHEPGEFRRIFSDDNYDELLPVPLFVKLPGQETGVIDDRNIESVDVVPTILDVLGVTPDWALDGTTILDESGAGRGRKTVYRSELGFSYYDPQFEEKYQALARKLGCVGTGRDPLALYRIGPHGELVGRDVEDLSTVGAGVKFARIDEADALKDVSLSSPNIPVIISGRVVGGRRQQKATPLAISLNDVIVAVTESYVTKKRGRFTNFACLIPESALREGNNELGVFVIGEDRDGKSRLERLELK